MQTASVRRFPRPFIALRACALQLGGVLLMTLASAGVQAQAYRNPLVNTASVTAPADISDPTPGNNSGSDSNTLAASAQLSVVKSIVLPAAGAPVAAGGAVQYRIEVRNAGPSQAVGAILTDSVPAQLSGVTWTCAPVSGATSCSAASGTGNLNVSVNVGVGEVLVVLVNGTAPGVTPATVSANVATIAPPPGTTDPTPGDNTATTPTITVQAAPIVATNDDFSATPLSPGAGGTTATVFTNDTLNGAGFAPAAVVPTLTSAPSGYAIGADGTISVPATAPAGPVTLTYQICEAASPGNCASANVTLVVSPDAVDDSVAVQAGGTLNGDVSTNDNAFVGSTFIQTGTAPAQGAVVLQANGSFTYTANAGATGTDTFSYQVCLPAPNAGVCDTAVVTVNLTANVIDAVNDDFSAAPVPAAAGGVTASVLTNDTFNGSQVVPANLTTTLITAPAGYTIDAAGAISVPANAMAGAVTLGYRICLTAAPTLCDTATVQVVVAPTAVNDAVTTPGAGQPVAGNVGSNDNTPAGSAFTASGAVATQGAVTLNGDGTFSYLPNAGAAGTDTFGYQVCLPAPNGAVCSTATVTVTLGANVLVANDDLFPTPIPAIPGGTTPSVLGNDTLNGAGVVQGTVTATLQGTVSGFTLDGTTGAITVAPNVPAGATALSYQLCENAAPANCSIADVQVLVSPGAVADTVPAQSGQPVTGSVATNDNTPAGSVFAALTQPTQGTLLFSDDGSFTYTSAAGSTGSDSSNYQVCLPAPNVGVCATTTATFTIAANTVDAVDDPFTTPAVSPVTGGSTPSVLTNDLFNGAPVTAAQVTLSLVNTPPPGFTITSAGVINVPAGAAAGAVSITYELCEAGTTTNCDTAQVALLISPAAVDDSYTTPAGQPLVGDVSLNDNAPAAATYTLLTPPASGTFVLQANGSFTYTPVAAGPQTVQYQVCLPAPDAATCATGTVNITVIANTLNAVDDNFRAPVFAPGAGGTTPSVLGNDTFNGAPVNPLQVTVNLVTPPAGFSIDGAGIITVSGFAPAGAGTLTYALCELGSTTNCDTAAVQVLVSPDAVDDTATVTGTQPGSFDLAANDNAPAGSTYAVTIAPGKGVATLSAAGTLQYTANAGQSGADTLTYQVCLPAPDAATCDTAQVAITLASATIVAVNDDYSASPIPPAGGSTASVLLNDSFNGAAIVPGTTPVTASLTTLVSGYSMAADGVITVAAGTLPGSTALNYQVCETALPTNCAAATAVVVMSPDAVNDTLPATAGATTVLNVLANDIVPLAPVVTVTVPPPGGNAVVNGDGTISYTPTGPFVGPDSLTYQLCLPAPHGSVCDTAVVSLTVSATTLVAVNDSFTATPIAPATGGTTASVLVNDTFNGALIVPGTTPVTATLLDTVPGYTMTADGVVAVAPDTTPAAVSLRYQVCENALPTNCAAATAVVAVSPDAVADTLPATAGTTTVLNVLANDTAPLNPVVSVTVAAANGTAVANGDGSVSYTPNVGYVGADSFTYQLCLPAPGATVCDTATVSVNVTATGLTAASDDFTASPVSPITGGSTTSVLLNDTFNGAPIVPGTTAVTASLVNPVAGYTMAADGVITVAAGTPPAAVTLSYQVCEDAVPGNCAASTALVAVSPDAVDDVLPAAANTTTVLNVLANDAAPVNPVITVPAAPTQGAVVVNGDGTLGYTPTAGYTGPDSFTYQVCLPSPGSSVCDTATVSLTVGNTSLTAAADDFTTTPIAPATGGTTASVLLNDTFNGVPIVPGTTAVTATLTTPVPGYTMAADGVVTVAAGLVPAAVALSYQVCENAVPTNCAASTARVAVSPDAVDDVLPAAADATTVLNVTTNDTLPATPVITVPVPPTNGVAVVNGDGSLSYTPTAGFTGADSFTYQVCLPAPDTTVCDTASVNLTVANTTIGAAADDFTGTPITPAAGGSTASVLLNDTFNSAPIVPGTTAVTATLITPVPGYTMAPDGVITVAAGLTPVAATLNYQVCENAVPTNCAVSTARVAVRPNAVDDALPAAAGTTTVLDVTANDTLPSTPVISIVVAPGNGTVVVNGDGTLSYTPTAGFTGPVSFTYQVCLPAPDNTVCDTASVNLTVANTTLAALPDDFTGTPLAPATGGSTASVLLNDTFNGVAIVPGTTAVAASLVAPPAGYSMSADGVITVAPGTTPAAATLNYQVCENALPTNCAGTTVIVAVSPEAVADALPATAGTSNVLDVLANDVRPLNPVVSVTAPPANGTATVNGDGTISYTPTAGFTGADSLTYQLCLPAPGATVCDTATVSITVSASGLAALDDNFSNAPIAPATGGTTLSVLLNDTFNGSPIVPGTTPVSASLVGAVANYTMASDGVISVAANTPPAATTLIYQVCEVAVPTNCAQATAVVAVRPDATDDTLNAAAGTTTVLTVTGNDTLPANPVISVPVQPASGTVVVNPDGTLSYTPTGAFTGTDTFTYQVCLPAPNGTVCDSASVTLTVAATSVVATADNFSSTPVAPTGGTTPSVLLNDFFNGNPIVPGTTPVTATLVTPPANYSMAADGVVTVAPGTTPAAVTLTYQVCETAVPTNCAQSTTLVAVRPDAANDTLTAGTGTTVLNVAINDTLPANPVFTVSVVPANGTAVVNGDNTISYTPNAGFTGADSFTYQVCLPAPNLTVCDTATVSLTVAAGTLVANDDPFDGFPTAPGAGGVTPSVLNNDTLAGVPVLPTQVTVSLLAPPAAITIDANGIISIGGAAAAGVVTLTYRICEATNSSNCDTATVLVLIRPDAVNDVATTPGGQTLTGTLAANDNVPPGGVFSLVTAPAQGTVVLNANGSYSYSPVAGYAGADSFIYRLCLPAPYAGICDTATLTVTVGASVLDAVDDTVTDVPATGGTGVLNVLVNDTFNGTALDPTTVLLTPTNTTAITIQPNGSVDVSGGVAGATYTTTYRICLVSQPAVCDIGTVSVTLASPPTSTPVQPADDTASTPQDTAVVIPVLANDLVGGTPALPSAVVVTITTAPTSGAVEVLTDGTVRYTPNGMYSGSDTFGYTVCTQATPVECGTGLVTVQVQANDVDVVEESVTAEDGEPVTFSILDNVSTTGAPINWRSFRILFAARYGRVECTDGTCVYTAFVGYSGADRFTYNICDMSIPTPVCVDGTVNITVVAGETFLRLSKQAAQRTVKVGELMRYTVTVENMGEVDALGVTVLDTLPAGFTFVQEGFAVSDIDNAGFVTARTPLRVDGIDIPAGGQATLVYYLRVGAGVGQGIHTNRVTALNVANITIGNVASADVEVVGDPLLDESLILGSVFEDRNGNGLQDDGERGIPGVRVASVEGLVMETDAFGRYHLVGIDGGGARGRNFILKVDPTTLPADARFTTRNPLLRRVTPGLPVRFDFGVQLPDAHLETGPVDDTPRPVQLDLGEGVFVAGTATLADGSEAVLAHATALLQSHGGGRLRIKAPPGQEALALQRVEAVRHVVLPGLPAEVAARVRIVVQPIAPTRPADRAER